MGKTIMICPHCGRLAWLPEVTCVHCSCLMTNYRRWIAADDEGKKEILSKINQPKEYKPMENKEWLDEADKTDAKIRRYLEKEKEQAKIEAAKPKYVPNLWLTRPVQNWHSLQSFRCGILGLRQWKSKKDFPLQ